MLFLLFHGYGYPYIKTMRDQRQGVPFGIFSGGIKMTFKEIDEKYKNIDLDTVDVDTLREYKNDCFKAYEESGFCDTYKTQYENEQSLNGKRFKVIGRVTELSEKNPEGADLECLPMWFIKFETGQTMAAYPEEICKIEREL